jgi:undecaprenyl-diphosphatase
MEYITAIDRSIFLFINHLPHVWISDSVARLLSGIGEWGFIWFILAAILFFREEKRDHWFFLPFILSTVFGSFISELVLKYYIARPRPSLNIGATILASPGNFSFPSTHATLAFAMAYILSREEPRKRRAFFILAILISVSRIYLGVHYPLDVVAGMILGYAIGWASFWIAPKILRWVIIRS